MTTLDRLEGKARHDALASLPDWSEVKGRDAITRSFQFGNFRKAFAFMTEVALLAEKRDHHPEWHNVYGRVDVVLTTHAARGLTMKDVEMAQKMDAISAA